MKVISIRQPWAWAIIHGGKDVENRNWSTAYRGPLFIHAGKKMTSMEYGDFAEVAHNAKIKTMPAPHELEFGGIIGIVDLVDVVHRSKSPWFFGDFGLVLRNPRPLPFRPMTGQLGLFNPPADLKGLAHVAKAC